MKEEEELFSQPDPLDSQCTSMVEYYQWEKMRKWRYQVWKECCVIGPGNLFVFQMPRRAGMTRMAYRIAEQVGNVLTLHHGQRNLEMFNEVSEAKSFVLDVDVSQHDMIIVDSADRIQNFNTWCDFMLGQGKTVLAFVNHDNIDVVSPKKYTWK